MTNNRYQTTQMWELLELTNYILYFRLEELQSLLAFANINPYGSMLQLQSRAFHLLYTAIELIKYKVREIYYRAQSNACYAGQYRRMWHSNRQQSAVVPTRHYSRTMRNNAAVAPNGRHMRHPASVISNTRSPSVSPCPSNVRLRPISFFDVLATLIQPSKLLSSSQSCEFPLNLTQSQKREVRNGVPIQVHLRFCKLETSCDQEDCFPPGIQVRVNNKMVHLPSTSSTNRVVVANSPTGPVNITQYVHTSKKSRNQIHVQWNTEDNRGFVAACYLVRKLSSSDLFRRLELKGPKPIDYTRNLIKQKFEQDENAEVAITLLNVSLICPLGKARIKNPCRASTCNHLQCFDASIYIEFNERNPRWVCPVCQKEARYELLYIDTYFKEVIESSSLTLNDKLIQVHSDGTWSTSKTKIDSMCLETPTKPTKPKEIGVNENNSIEATAGSSRIDLFGSRSMRSASKKRPCETIEEDLTIVSDELSTEN